MGSNHQAVFIDSIYNLQIKPGKGMQISKTELLHANTNTASNALISLWTISWGKPSRTSWLWDRSWKLARGHRPCGRTGVVKLRLPVPQVHELICCDTLESHRFKGNTSSNSKSAVSWEVEKRMSHSLRCRQRNYNSGAVPCCLVSDHSYGIVREEREYQTDNVVFWILTLRKRENKLRLIQ